MKRIGIKRIGVVIVFFILSGLSPALAWNDGTHLAVAKAAGYFKWYNAAGADMAKIKAGHIEQYNHYFDNNEEKEVTPLMVLSQADRYNSPDDSKGHLYGAIIAALREFKNTSQEGRYPEYHVAFCAHYVGDLSQPLHNTSNDDFNKEHHSANDGIVEKEILGDLSHIRKNMYSITLRPDHFEEDLAKEISRIANLSRELGLRLRKENRDMTKEEAYRQLGHSASLLKAILKYLGKE
jgi:hypothetical protein